MRVRVGKHAAQTIDRPHDDARRPRATKSSSLRRALCAALVAGAPFIAAAQPTPEPSAEASTAPASEWPTALTALLPSSVFVQAGAGAHVDTGSLGAIWALPWQRDVSFGQLTTSIEAAFGEWQTHGQRHHSHPFTQIGFTPMLRFYPDAWHARWFVEAGIGANVIAPSYHTDGKRFSTAFNFGDHVGIGREFGARHQQEIALRIEHFSNAGIDHPNPGENFLQLRWVVRC